jgi:hypothetical protein
MPILTKALSLFPLTFPYCDGFAESIARQRLGKHVPTHAANNTVEIISMWSSPFPVLGNVAVNIHPLEKKGVFYVVRAMPCRRKVFSAWFITYTKILGAIEFRSSKGSVVCLEVVVEEELESALEDLPCD